MGDRIPKKIHPVVEAEAELETRKMLPQSSSKFSERGGSGKYVELGGSHHTQLHNNHYRLRALPPLPPPETSPGIKKGSFSCCRCICWTILFLILLILAVIASVGILYIVFQPKLPQYSIDRLQITALRLNLDTSLYAQFTVRITATNPNEKIGIYYQKGSHLSVWYTTTNLCQGSLPVFYQGHLNKTVLNLALTGQNQYGQALLSALQQQQQTGKIPLNLKISVPVRIKLGGLKMIGVRILGTCLLSVDSLSAKNMVSIQASSCKFRFHL